MENKIHVSIIVPCYNIEQYIAKCVDSILVQTYTNFELLLIDDGSSDQTLDIIKSYAATDPRVVAVNHANRGVSYTRNKGITLAKGDYIMFIDGDDFIKQDFIERHLEYAADDVLPISGMINVDNGQERENIFRRLLNNTSQRLLDDDNFFILFKYHSLSSPCGRIYSVETLRSENILFNEDVTYQEDLLFNLAYLRSIHSVYLMGYFGYFYVKHPESSTNRFHKNFEYADIMLNDLLLYTKHPNDEEYIKQFIFDTCLRRLSNEVHRQSPLSIKRKLKNIKYITRSKSFIYCYDYIADSRASFLTKEVLKSKNEYLIFCYLLLIRYVN